MCIRVYLPSSLCSTELQQLLTPALQKNYLMNVTHYPSQSLTRVRIETSCSHREVGCPILRQIPAITLNKDAFNVNLTITT